MLPPYLSHLYLHTKSPTKPRLDSSFIELQIFKLLMENVCAVKGTGLEKLSEF